MRWEVALTGNSLGAWQNNVRAMELFAERRGATIRNLILRSNRFTFPRVLRVSPREVVLEEETEVTLAGLRFTRDTGIALAGIPSPRVEYASSRELLVVVPFDMRLQGEPEITASDPVNGSSSSEGLLRVSFVRPQVSYMQPASGAEQGGDLVYIFGDDFTAGVRVDFGDVPAPRVMRVQESRSLLEVETPPGLGVVPVRVFNTRPGDLPADAVLEFSYLPPEKFRRGDADGDGRLTIGDAVTTLRHLFRRGSGALCEDALDTDDSGEVSLSDAVVLLNYLLRPAAVPPAPPVASCGVDPTADSLGCDGPTACR
jgi:hypothetical protein